MEQVQQYFKPMKTKLSFFAMSLLFVLAVSCDVERSEKYQTLLAERDSLYTQAVAATDGKPHILRDDGHCCNTLGSTLLYTQNGRLLKHFY